MPPPSHFPTGSVGKVLFGNCGWTQDKSSPWSSCRTPHEKLEVYSRYFSCAEVDTTTYAIPTPSVVQEWLSAKLPPGFVFHVKLFGLLAAGRCQYGQLPVAVRELLGHLKQRAPEAAVQAKDMSAEALQKCWDMFNDMLSALNAKDRLGTVVLQHQNDVLPSRAARLRTEEIRYRLLPSAALAVEFRNRDWIGTDEAFDETVHWLNDACGGAAIICADDLLHELRPDRKLGPDEARCRLPLRLALEGSPGWAYCRIHRRQGGVPERLLLAEEVLDWQAKVTQAVNGGAFNRGPCYILMGTDSCDAPIRNAMAIAKGGKADWSFDWAAHRKCNPPQATLTALFRSQSSPTTTKSDIEKSGGKPTSEMSSKSSGFASWVTPPRAKCAESDATLHIVMPDATKGEVRRTGRSLETADKQMFGKKRSLIGKETRTLESVFAKKQRRPAAVECVGTQEDADIAEAIRRSLADTSIVHVL